jgi:pimeloyl-ACP methyl ester carboxylesterase
LREKETNNRMIAPLAKLMDWSAVQVLTVLMPSYNLQNPRLEEALEFLKRPECIPDESQPARVEFGPDASGMHFRFSTPRPGDFVENNIVYGRLYRCAGRWQERPAIILLHGSGGFPDYHFRFPLMARRFNRAGFNVATLVAPNNLQRRPRQLKALNSVDCLQLAEGAAQAIAEIRALTGWLLGQGCPAVTLWGFSMGAWYAGMAVCRDARLASVVLAMPAVRMNPWMEQRAIRPRIRRNLPRAREVCEMLNLTALSLTVTRPAIPKGNILLVEGIHDLFVPKEDVEDLWKAWGQPDIWRLPHGHFSLMFVPGLTGRVLRWLAPRLEEPAIRA